jgi:hypothetical protein
LEVTQRGVSVAARKKEMEEITSLIRITFYTVVEVQQYLRSQFSLSQPLREPKLRFAQTLLQ